MTEPNPQGQEPKPAATDDELLERRERLACDVCGNMPDEHGVIEHGRGCYTQSEDGGGTSYVDLEEITTE